MSKEKTTTTNYAIRVNGQVVQTTDTLGSARKLARKLAKQEQGVSVVKQRITETVMTNFAESATTA